VTTPEPDLAARRQALFDALRRSPAPDEAQEPADGAPQTADPPTDSTPSPMGVEPGTAAALGESASLGGVASLGEGAEMSSVATDPPLPSPDPAPLVTRPSGTAAPALDTTDPDPPLPTLGPANRHPAADQSLPRIMAIANQKGGVGKTTTAVNLSAALAELGYRVLVIDLDPQGNATTGLGINARNLEGSIYDVLMHDVAIEECIEPTAVRNLFVAPATIDLAGAEIELVPAFSRELKLRRALTELDEPFDFTVIDCPPSLGLLTVNGLAAATEVVVPIQCEYYALEGLGQLLRNVGLVQGNLNPQLIVSAVIMTMYDARTKLSEQVLNEVRAHFGPRVCRNIVPRTVRLSEAPSFGQPIIVFDPSSRGAVAYRELAKEVSGGPPQRTR